MVLGVLVRRAGRRPEAWAPSPEPDQGGGPARRSGRGGGGTGGPRARALHRSDPGYGSGSGRLGPGARPGADVCVSLPCRGSRGSGPRRQPSGRRRGSCLAALGALLGSEGGSLPARPLRRLEGRAPARRVPWSAPAQHGPAGLRTQGVRGPPGRPSRGVPSEVAASATRVSPPRSRGCPDAQAAPVSLARVPPEDGFLYGPSAGGACSADAPGGTLGLGPASSCTRAPRGSPPGGWLRRRHGSVVHQGDPSPSVGQGQSTRRLALVPTVPVPSGRGFGRHPHVVNSPTLVRRPGRGGSAARARPLLRQLSGGPAPGLVSRPPGRASAYRVQGHPLGAGVGWCLFTTNSVRQRRVAPGPPRRRPSGAAGQDVPPCLFLAAPSRPLGCRVVHNHQLC